MYCLPFPYVISSLLIHFLPPPVHHQNNRLSQLPTSLTLVYSVIFRWKTRYHFSTWVFHLSWLLYSSLVAIPLPSLFSTLNIIINRGMEIRKWRRTPLPYLTAGHCRQLACVVTLGLYCLDGHRGETGAASLLVPRDDALAAKARHTHTHAKPHTSCRTK